MAPVTSLHTQSPSFFFPFHLPSQNPRIPSSINKSLSVPITNHIHHHQNRNHKPIPIFSISLISSKPKSSFIPSSSISRGQSFSPNRKSDKTLNPIVSVFKTPLCIAVVASSLLLFQFSNIALAHVPPAMEETVTSGQEEKLDEEEEEKMNVEEVEYKKEEEDKKEEMMKKEKVKKEYDEEMIYEKVLNKDPDNVEVLQCLMSVRIDKENFQGAVEAIDRLMVLEPYEVEWPLMRVHIYLTMGEIGMAKESFKEVLKKEWITVDAFKWMINAARTLEKESEGGDELGKVNKKVEEAIHMCWWGKKRKDELRDLKFLIGEILAKEGKYEEGLKVYTELAKEEPRDFRPYLWQGMIYTLLGNKYEAKKNFERYRRLVPRRHPYGQHYENVVTTTMFGQLVEQEEQKQG